MNDQQRQQLQQTALQSIQHGLDQGLPLKPATDDALLLAPGASFVTLQLQGALRGCIGSLQAHRSLIDDVAQNAFSAAFRDPRFAPVSARELPLLEIHISLLSDTTPMQFQDEADLLRQLRPGIDGLVLSAGQHRSTFLPQVWEQLPQPVDFLRQLKCKAGLPANYWGPDLHVQRYTVDSIS